VAFRAGLLLGRAAGDDLSLSATGRMGTGEALYIEI
jgi:hypothetical protein